MNPVRIACVRYLNTAPLIEGLSKLNGAEVIPVVPSKIADLVLSGRADVGLVSMVDAARAGSAAGGGLALLPVGMIGCNGPTLTVRLFSSVPMGQVSAIHADTDSHTSVVLAQVILARTYGARPRVVDFDARERVARAGSGVAGESAEWPQTLLLIGDKVVSDSPPAVRYPHQLDLGEAWKALTGLPFVYAMWMCRADRAGDPVIASAAALLDRQRRHNAMRIDWIVSQRAPEHRWPIDLAAQYLGRLLRYEVGDAERQAVERFFDEASSLGLVPRPGLTWAMEPTGAERRVAL